MAGKRRSRKLTVALAALVAFVLVGGGITAWAWLKPPATTLTATLDAVSFEYGAPVTLSVALKSDDKPFVGTIAVKVGEFSKTAITDSEGRLAVTLSSIDVGKQKIVISYAGDDKRNPVTVSKVLQVTPATASLTLTTKLDGVKHKLIAQVSTSSGVAADGKVAFTLDGKSAGAGSLTKGSASVVIEGGLGLGDHKVVAIFAPTNATQVTTAEAATNVSIIKSNSSISATLTEPEVRYGDKATVAIAVTTAGDPAGAVAIMDGASKLAEGVTDATGKATLTFINPLDPGSKDLKVTFAGSGTVSAAETAVALKTTQTNVDILIERPEDLQPGGDATITVSVLGTPKKPTGKATVSYDGKVIADAAVDANGKIAAAVKAVPEGEHSIEVTYVGDVRFQADKATSTLAAKKPVPNPNADGATAINANNPCPAAASACVNLSNTTAWLQSGGKVTYGPVPMTSGRAGHRTGTGMFSVFWLDKDHKSSIFNDAPMPNSVFFNGGIAFHQGSLSVQSHGCIHLSWAASETFFSTLSVGQKVYVFGAPPY